MCSRNESVSREEEAELSSFESTLATSSLASRNSQRVADPRLAVKKYRRSAAGGGVRSYGNDESSRSISDLHATVMHLTGSVFCRRRLEGVYDFCQEQHTVAAAVGFVSDRLRAISVDLTQCGVESEETFTILGVMFRFHLLAGYLCCELPLSKFQKRFNDQAIMSTLSMLQSCYKNISSCG